MARHLKSIVKNRLNGIITRYIPNAEVSASHRRGVCYLEFIPAIKMYYGAMSTHKEGRRYKKHIIVRRVPRWGGKLHQLYTYHLPKTWSAACVANRELIKAAQQKALEPSTPEEDVTFTPIESVERRSFSANGIRIPFGYQASHLNLLHKRRSLVRLPLSVTSALNADP